MHYAKVSQIMDNTFIKIVDEKNVKSISKYNLTKEKILEKKNALLFNHIKTISQTLFPLSKEEIEECKASIFYVEKGN